METAELGVVPADEEIKFAEVDEGSFLVTAGPVGPMRAAAAAKLAADGVRDWDWGDMV